MPNDARIRTELDILSTVERGEVMSQSSIAQRVGVAVGLANAVLKRAVRKGYVKMRSAPLKRYAYYVTPTGFAEKSRLVAAFLETSLDFFRKARAQYADAMARIRAAGAQAVVLAGSGELAEIAMLAAAEHGLAVVAILDPHGEAGPRLGVPVVRRVEDLPPHGAIVVTEQRRPQAVFDALAAHPSRPTVIHPPLLRIVPDPWPLAEGGDAP